MASEIRVNRLSNRSGLSTITFANGGVQFSGITTFANGDFRVGTGATILNPSANEMQFHTGGSNRLTINNAGLNLGIGSITVGDATFTGSVSIGKTLTYEDVKNVDSIGVVTARTGVKVTGGDFTVGTAITASSVTGNVTQDVGITTYSGSAVWFKGATANKDMYWSHASGSTVYKDNAQILMGDSSDLQIYHSGSHSFVEDTGAGVLSLKSNGSGIMLEHAGTGYMMKAFTGGAVEIYNNNSKKFETTSSGISVTGGVSISGSSTFTGNVFDFADSKQLRFGTGNDFELFFNGTDQYLKSKAGKIRVQVVDGESAITCNPNAGIELFYDDVKKFETTTNGVIIQGNANVSDSSGYGGSANHFFSAGNSNDLKLYHHGSWGSSYINNSGSGALFLESDDLRFRKANGTEIYFKAVADGAVELYHNNLKRFETTADGCLLGDSRKLQFGAGPDLEIYSDATNAFIKCPDTGNNLTIESDQHLYIKVGDSEDAIKCVNGQAVELYHNNSKKLETSSTGINVTGKIYPTGNIHMPDNVGIKLGASDDLLMYHVANSHNYIQSEGSSQDLFLQSKRDFYIKAGDNAGGYHTSIYCDNNGGVRLSYDNSPKLYTKSFGVQIEMSPRMDLYGTGNNIELKFITNSGTHRGSVYADNGNTIGFLKAGTGAWAARWHHDGKQTSHGDIWPNAEDTYDLGDGSYRWNNAFIKKICLNTSSTNSQLTINSESSANAVSIRNTTGGNGNVGILFSTQDHSGGREKAAIYHQETHGTAHYGGDFIFCLNTATGSAGQVGPSDERMRITKGGQLSLQGDTDTYLQRTDANEWRMYVNGDWSMEWSANKRILVPQVYSTNGSSMRDVQVESDGTLCAGNTSIRASKKNIVSQTDVSWLYDLNPVTFNYRKHTVDKVTGVNTYLEEIEDETSYGLIAEEVETVKKDFCFYNKDKDDNDELAGVAYKELITPLLKALQDQKKEIDSLKVEVAALKSS